MAAAPVNLKGVGWICPLACRIADHGLDTAPRLGLSSIPVTRSAPPAASLSAVHDPVDRFGAFCRGPSPELPTVPDGPLAGLRLAVKDLFDIAGRPTGAGNPTWAASHAVPAATAPAVQHLLAAGARFAGKTVTDELAYSLMGRNAHFGTPINPAAPDRLAGGSSSGSAAAVAGGLAEIGLGTDTGGSIRLPGSFCGLYGFRPSHGRIPIEGVVKLAPSFDTVGWLTRDAATLARVAAVFGIVPDRWPSVRLLLAEDAFAASGEAVTKALREALDRVSAVLGPARPIVLAEPGLGRWREVFRICQAAEVWATHRAWVEAVRPGFGPGVAERFAAASRLTPAEIADARRDRQAVRARLASLLAGDTLVCLPTAPGPAPLRSADAAAEDRYRALALELLCPAGLAGLPQVTLPLATIDGAPLGLSLLAGPGRDEFLLGALDRLGAAAPLEKPC
jgi:amidase